MSVKSQVQVAEEALRQALINALAEGEEEYLSELFVEYQHVSDLNKKIEEHQQIQFSSDPDYSFSLSSDYLKPGRIGGDLDALDDVTFAAGPVNIKGAFGEDVIDFGDYKSQQYRPDQSRNDLKLALVGMGFTTPRVSCFSIRTSGADGKLSRLVSYFQSKNKWWCQTPSVWMISCFASKLKQVACMCLGD